MVKNRLNQIFLPAEVLKPKRPQTSTGELPRELEALFKRPERQSRSTLRELMFLPSEAGLVDRRDAKQKDFDKYCTDKIEELLRIEQPDEQSKALAAFAKDVQAQIQANPKLQESFQELLFTNLHANGTDIEANDILLSRIILACYRNTVNLLFMLMTREPGATVGSDKFMKICKQEALVKDFETLRFAGVYLSSGCQDQKDLSVFAKNLIAICNNPSTSPSLIYKILHREIKNFEEKAEEVIKLYGESDADDENEYGGGVITDDDPGELSFEEAAAQLVEISVRIYDCQELMLELYRNHPDPQSLTAKELSRFVKSIAFDTNHLVDLVNIEEELEEDDGEESEFALHYLPSQELAGKILDCCANMVNKGSTQYTKKTFVQDLKYLIKHNLEFNDLRTDLLCDCFYQLYYQDPEACKTYVIKILNQDRRGDGSLDGGIRKDLIDMLEGDDRLIDLLVEEINLNDPGRCPNLLTIFTTAHNKQGSYPLLQAVLNHPKLDFETLMDKLPAALSNSALSFPDCRNIICRQFDAEADCLLAERMEQFALLQQKQAGGTYEPINLETITEGAYKDWLLHIREHKPATFDVTLN